jgi:small subunit ribosomal protein S4
MTRNTESKCKLCRAAGKKLMLKGEKCTSAKCPMLSRNYPPGLHGPKGRKKTSGYGIQLKEKQKAKQIYGMREKQFKLLFDRAQKKGNAGENLLKFLEMRLDNVVFRLGFASSRPQARQLVNHAHFTVNDIKVNIPSYQVKAGDLVKIRKSSQKNKYFNKIEEKMKKMEIPGWLNYDKNESFGKILHEPGLDDLDKSINSQIIVEFYSR